MDNTTVSTISKKIYAKFPEVRGAKPKVTEYGENQYLIIYSGMVMSSNGKPIPRTVRAVVDESGKIIKTTTSR
ncbi:MAG: hypothetical protein AB9891_15525 [Anaerolineaceae bacterium]